MVHLTPEQTSLESATSEAEMFELEPETELEEPFKVYFNCCYLKASKKYGLTKTTIVG